MPILAEPMLLSSPEREFQLLLGCARTAPAMTLHAGEIDWQVLLDLGSRHRVLPLLAKNLPSIGGTPPEVTNQLRAFAANNAVQALSLMYELTSLLRLFAAENIAAVPFKGPILANSVYGDVGLRHAGDLDLLVRRSDIVRAKAILDRLGYESIYPTSTPREQRYLQDLSQAEYAAYLGSQSEHHLVRTDGRITVDLHWDLAPREFSAGVEQDELWSWLSPLPTGQLTFRDPELLLVLCLNGAKDCWARLDRVCDVAELLCSRPALKWGRVFELATRLGWRRMLAVGLVLAGKLLDAPLPDEVARKIEQDPTAVRLAEQSARKMMHPSVGPVEGASGQKSLYYFRVRERTRDRLRYLSNQLVPTIGDAAALPLPRHLNFLHYLVRPFRLAARYSAKSQLDRRDRR